MEKSIYELNFEISQIQQEIKKRIRADKNQKVPKLLEKVPGMEDAFKDFYFGIVDIEEIR